MDRLQALVEIVLASGLVSSVIASVPLALADVKQNILLKDARVIAGFVVLEASITLLIIFFIMKTRRESLHDLGWKSDQWHRNALLGLGLVPLLFFINTLIAHVFSRFFPKHFTTRNPLIETIQSPQDLIVFVLAALFAGGIKEELQRAFILSRFQDHLGGAAIGLILWSVFFGAGHYLQGVQGAVAAGLFGFLFGALYLLRGSLIGPIVAHSLYDTLALVGYWYLK